MMHVKDYELMTIDRFNKLTRQETLHPLICTVDLSKAELSEDIRMACDFYGILYYPVSKQDEALNKEWLRLVYPGETIEIPSKQHRPADSYSGVLFHPDLLCDTPLEYHIKTYPKHGLCPNALSKRESSIITENLREIGEELHHAIDRHSASIISSHIELLLNYCARFCTQQPICNKYPSNRNL